MPRHLYQGLFAAIMMVSILTGCTSCGGGQTSVIPPPPPLDLPDFNSALAFASLEAQCEFGPRNPGSEGHTQCGAWLEAELNKYSEQVIVQGFEAETLFGGPYNFKNLLAVFPGKSTAEPLLLGAHWDTRPVADHDPDPKNANTPILGANDGASGVAVLLEFARLMKETQPSRTIIIGFFDAEDSGKSGSKLPYVGFCIGSAYLAENWPSEAPRPAEMILLDLVGADKKNNPRLDPDGEINPPEFELEEHSLDSNPSLVDAIWSAAEDLGHSAFTRKYGGTMIDDHLPFIENGIPGVDIIHAMPAEWHTIDDTPEHCSAETLNQVGDTLVRIIWE